MRLLFACFAVASAASTVVLSPPGESSSIATTLHGRAVHKLDVSQTETSNIAYDYHNKITEREELAQLKEVGHPSISLLAGLEKKAGHASSISLFAVLKKDASLRKKQLAKHREGLVKLVKLVQTSKKSSTPHNTTTLAKQNPALSPPPATPPDSNALSADYKALYDQSEARRLAQIKLCDDCKLAEDALVLAFEDAEIKHKAAEDKAVLLITASTEYIDAKSDYDAKVVEFVNKKTGVVSVVSALTHDSAASAFTALGQMATELGTLASEETSLEGIMNTKLAAKKTAQSAYATAAATAKTADSVADAKTTERGTACTGLKAGPSAPPYMPPSMPPSTPPAPYTCTRVHIGDYCTQSPSTIDGGAEYKTVPGTRFSYNMQTSLELGTQACEANSDCVGFYIDDVPAGGRGDVIMHSSVCTDFNGGKEPRASYYQCA